MIVCGTTRRGSPVAIWRTKQAMKACKHSLMPWLADTTFLRSGMPSKPRFSVLISYVTLTGWPLLRRVIPLSAGRKVAQSYVRPTQVSRPSSPGLSGGLLTSGGLMLPFGPVNEGARSVHMRSLPITRTCCSTGHRRRATLRHLPMNSVTVFTASSLENKEFSINRRLSHLLKQHPCSVRPSRTTGCSQCLKTQANGSHFSQQRLKTRSQPCSVRWR